MKNQISVIDLFAGPGGLGEGFSSYQAENQANPFKIALSVEMEPNAHQTLTLRAFYRQFSSGAPDEYYNYLKGNISKVELFALYPDQSEAATAETLGGPRELGNVADDSIIRKGLRKLKNNPGPKVLIGGPPCQAYSLVGRSRNKGKKSYLPEADHRHFLYKEYLSVLQMVQPEVFVMENVKGILSSKINGKRIFPTILGDLGDPSKALGKKKGAHGYRIYSLVSKAASSSSDVSGSSFIIKAEKYGIPQSRHRVILLGVRDDITWSQEILDPHLSKRRVGQLIDDLPRLRSGLSRGGDSNERWHKAVATALDRVRKCVPYGMFSEKDFSGVLASACKLDTRGERFMDKRRAVTCDSEMANWFLDPKLGGFVNHDTRGHMAEDLARYLFCSLYAKKHRGKSPTANNFPAALTPKHKNWKSGNFVDRFKVQAANRPSGTITSHISKDGHYFIHPDPGQCRSLTVREAARLQTFPDNYFFEGARTAQYHQVGNAVPPLLARQIAAIVFRIMT
jgi:DNA (cytosine-5)-methyltransferase 1